MSLIEGHGRKGAFVKCFVVFLVACNSMTRYVCRSVGPSVGWSVRVSFFGRFMKVGQHFYLTLLYLRMRAFGALSGFKSGPITTILSKL